VVLTKNESKLGRGQDNEKIQAQHLVYGGGQRVQWLQQRETNLKVINWYEQVMGLEGLQMAQQVSQYLEKRESLCRQKKWISQAGIKLGAGYVTQLVNKMGTQVRELSLGLDSGTGLPWVTREVKKQLDNLQGLIINRTIPRELWVESWSETEIHLVVKKMQKQGIIIWIDYNEENLPKQEEVVGKWEELRVRYDNKNWEGAWGRREVPMGLNKEQEWRVWVWVRQEQDMQLYEALRSTSQGPENMYKMEIRPEIWLCPFCTVKGEYVNRYFGICNTE